MADTGNIAGNVINLRINQPIAGASLKLTGDGVDESTSSGPDGSFGFDTVPAGTGYDLSVQKEGFEDGLYGPLTVVADATLTLHLGLQPKQA